MFSAVFFISPSWGRGTGAWCRHHSPENMVFHPGPYHRQKGLGLGVNRTISGRILIVYAISSNHWMELWDLKNDLTQKDVSSLHFHFWKTFLDLNSKLNVLRLLTPTLVLPFRTLLVFLRALIQKMCHKHHSPMQSFWKSQGISSSVAVGCNSGCFSRPFTLFHSSTQSSGVKLPVERGQATWLRKCSACCWHCSPRTGSRSACGISRICWKKNHNAVYINK